LLLRDLDNVAAQHFPLQVLIVDDASTLDAGAEFCRDGFRALTGVSVVRLRRNLGHQRAISVGLVHIYKTYPAYVTVVMDGDGEDRPEDIPRMLSKFNNEGGRKIVFAARSRRTENLTFKIFYRIYKLLHRALTGLPVRVGNFSAVPYSCLSSLVVVSEVWNHYAAAVFNARIPHDSIPAPRGERLAGKSRMNFVAFVTHGLSAISVYSERVGTRLLVLSVGTIVLLMLAIIATLFVRLFTTLAIAGWATYVTGLLLVLLLQACALSFGFIFVVLNGRSGTMFIPIRDCPYFIDHVTPLWPSNDSSDES
jgi:glycosyltransferase involved in cell wall biosynthesis